MPLRPMSLEGLLLLFAARYGRIPHTRKPDGRNNRMKREPQEARRQNVVLRNYRQPMVDKLSIPFSERHSTVDLLVAPNTRDWLWARHEGAECCSRPTQPYDVSCERLFGS
ncbi:uncharacterized protein BJX67DRAFT_90587 [Aspergillus lucknowensis]|uniref:Secreted protein n=1 Tax=Aspergillus lucknowensis TaxID=176173 RepID=A0ABR4M5K6_9EURO